VEWNRIDMVVNMNETTPFKLLRVCIHKVKVTAVASIRFSQLVDVSVEGTNALLEMRSAVPEFDDSTWCTTSARCESDVSKCLPLPRYVRECSIQNSPQ
jgi:hypothetical protein